MSTAVTTRATVTAARPASPVPLPSDGFAVSLPDLRPGEAWRQLAACAGMDPELFYPDGGAPAPGKKPHIVYPAEAVAACNRCPVRRACLDYAITNRELYGLWGGKSPTERKKLRGATAACNGCGNQYQRIPGGLRYCPECRPTLGYIAAPTDVEGCSTMSDVIPEGV